jgi:hypothetical protein
MKNIHVISGYKTGDLGSSIRKITAGGLKDAGFNVIWHEHSDRSYNDIHNELVLCVFQPKRLSGVFEVLPKDNAIIYWNLEPITGKEEKRIRYRRLITKLTNQSNIKAIWMYNEQQCNIIPKTKFVPIAYHRSLETNSSQKNGVVFLGSDNTFRLNAFKSWGVKVTVQKNPAPDASITCLPAYLIGVDLTASTDYSEDYRWHRLMLYIAAGNTIITTSNLDRYGFIDGKDYFRRPIKYIGEQVKYLLRNRDEAIEVANNAKDYARSKFLAADMFKKALGAL